MKLVFESYKPSLSLSFFLSLSLSFFLSLSLSFSLSLFLSFFLSLSLSFSLSLCLLNDLKERERERKKQGVAERVREGVGVAERGGENYQLLLAGKAGFDKKSWQIDILFANEKLQKSDHKKCFFCSYKTSLTSNWTMLASGCGSVGREVVASDTRSPGFESSPWQKLIFNLFTDEKTKVKKKRLIIFLGLWIYTYQSGF